MWNRVLCRPFGILVLGRHAVVALLLGATSLLFFVALDARAYEAQRISDHAGRCEARGFRQGQVRTNKSEPPILFCVDRRHRVYWMD